MGWLDGFPFVSREERERRDRLLEKRICPFGVEAQREKARMVLSQLFPNRQTEETLFAFFDAKDAYTQNGVGETDRNNALTRLLRNSWMDDHAVNVMMCFIEMESEAKSLNEYPTANDVLAHCGNP